ncbi:MAG: 50S ribosomal protein L9 [Anaerolineae bacterium]
MKIILKQDVPNLGRKGDIEDVADGYARNYLIPKGMAVRATPGALRDFEHRQKVQAHKHQRMKKRAETLARRLTSHTLTFEVKTGDTGQLYGSITNADIAEALEEQVGEQVDKRDIPLPRPIRKVGEYFVPIRLMDEVEPQVRVVVKPESGEWPEDAELPERPTA